MLTDKSAASIVTRGLAFGFLFAAAAVSGCGLAADILLSVGCGPAVQAIDGLSVRWESSPELVRCSGHADQPYDVRPAECEWTCAEFQGRLAHVLVFFSVTEDATGFAPGVPWTNEPCVSENSDI